jgi:hypothetical protein
MTKRFTITAGVNVLPRNGICIHSLHSSPNRARRFEIRLQYHFIDFPLPSIGGSDKYGARNIRTVPRIHGAKIH